MAACILMKGLKECMLPARWVFPLGKLSCRENYLDSRNATVVFALCKRYRWLKFYYQCHQPEKLSGGPTSPSDLSCGQPKTWNTYSQASNGGKRWRIKVLALASISSDVSDRTVQSPRATLPIYSRPHYRAFGQTAHPTTGLD